jgi:CheY-like chemotaxis protein
MTIERAVLLVSPRASLARAIASSIGRLGYPVVIAKSFEEARAWWTSAPQLLVTDLKLGAHNGLHLALRAATTQTPAIVIADSSYEQEIEQTGAVWMAPDAALNGDLPAVAGQLLESGAATDRPPIWYEELPRVQAADAPLEQSSCSSD